MRIKGQALKKERKNIVRIPRSKGERLGNDKNDLERRKLIRKKVCGHIGYWWYFKLLAMQIRLDK
jgi:hypothetical protein